MLEAADSLFIVLSKRRGLLALRRAVEMRKEAAADARYGGTLLSKGLQGLAAAAAARREAMREHYEGALKRRVRGEASDTPA